MKNLKYYVWTRYFDWKQTVLAPDEIFSKWSDCEMYYLLAQKAFANIISIVYSQMTKKYSEKLTKMFIILGTF